MKEIKKLREEMNNLQGVLEEVNEKIDYIAKRMEDKAIFAYPNEASDDGLGEIHARLTGLAEKVIDNMQQVHKKLVNVKI